MYPEDLKYHAEHAWAKIDGDTATIGITDFAQEQLGEIVFVELPAVGATLEVGSAFAEVESTKSVSDVIAPLSGEVLEVNSEVAEAPELINKDCYGDGWLVKVKVSGGTDALLDADSYEASVAE